MKSTMTVDVDLRQEEVVRVFADVTRYPLEILDVEASLEDDLGIDSVKLGEIFSVLREKYRLPERLDIPVEQLRTIASISRALQEYLSTDGHSSAPSFQPGEDQVRDTKTKAPAADGPLDRLAVRTSVMDTFAVVTRYPREILDPEANLEEDLGIDSVKLGEIFSVLRERYALPQQLDIPVEQLKTIRGLSDALFDYLSARERSSGRTPSQAPAHAPSPHAGPARSAALLTMSNDVDASSSRREPERKPFSGKIAFVSGSGRGLGKDIAVHLASLGAAVVVNSFHSRDRGDETAAEIEQHGGRALHLWGSMANPDHLHRMFDEIEGKFGALDFFISNASNGMLARIEDLTVDHWEKAFRTNVIGLHQGAVRAARLMKKNGGGKIITLSSPAAHGYVDYFGCMGAVKAAVECLTRAMAIEFAPYNIQVNCVSPGPIDGDLLRKWPDSDRLIQQWTDATPIGRLCEHGDVSHFVAYLLSEPVRAFTGSVLVMDGGISAQGW